MCDFAPAGLPMIDTLPAKYDGNCLPHSTKSGTDSPEMTSENLSSDKFFLTH